MGLADGIEFHRNEGHSEYYSFPYSLWSFRWSKWHSADHKVCCHVREHSSILRPHRIPLVFYRGSTFRFFKWINEVQRVYITWSGAVCLASLSLLSAVAMPGAALQKSAVAEK